MQETMVTLWRWDAANQKYCWTISHTSPLRERLTLLSSLHPKVYTGTGRHRRYRRTFLMRYKLKSRSGIHHRIRHRRRNLGKGLRSVVCSAYCWQTWRVSHLQSYPSTLRYSPREQISYLLLMSLQQSRTRKPSARRRWSGWGRRRSTNGF